MSKAEETREFIIEKSAPIFNRKGYAATSLSDIIGATGLTKGAIYGNFENKDEVAIAAFKYNIRRLRIRITDAMQSKKTATEKLIMLTGYYRDNWTTVFARGGCPILNAATEADDSVAFLKKHVQQSIKNWVDGISGIIQEGQQKREFRKQIDPVAYAYTILTILEGGILLSKIMNNQHLLFSALDRIELLIDQELKK